MNVLIVEDDPELAALLRDGLREHRIDPTVATSFVEGRDQALVGDYDVIMVGLNVMSPAAVMSVLPLAGERNVGIVVMCAVRSRR